MASDLGNRGHAFRVAAEKMEQFGQNGNGSPRRQTQALERRVRAPAYPAVHQPVTRRGGACAARLPLPGPRRVEECQQSAGVGESLKRGRLASNAARTRRPACSARSGSPPRIVPAQRSAWLRIRSSDCVSSPYARLLASQSLTIVRNNFARLVLSTRASRSSASVYAVSSRQLQTSLLAKATRFRP